MTRLLNLLPWRRRRLEHDLQRELRHHIDQRIADLKQSGVSDAEARRRASIEFGNVGMVHEDVRDTWGWRWLDDLGRDTRYGARMLRRSPVFAATAMLSLAIGIGANAAIFSLVDRILLRLLAVDEPERLVQLAWNGIDLTGKWGGGRLVSYPLCLELESQTQLFDGVLCRHPTSVNLAIDGAPEQVRAEIVSGSYFQILGARPEAGRLLDRSDNAQPGAHPVVVLSYEYWRDRLDRAADVVGRTVRLNNYPMTVVGVAPPNFRGVDPHRSFAVWVPASMTVQAANIDDYWDGLLDRRAAWLHAIGRLRPSMSIEGARIGLRPWFSAMLQADTQREGFPPTTPEQLRGFLASSLDVLPVPQGMSSLRGAMERPLGVLLGGTVLLLGLASLNVAGLLLARGAARHREVSTRLSLGATRLRISLQLLVESTLITAAGALLGLAVAPLVSRFLLSLLARDRDISASIDRRVFAFAVLTTAVTAIVCSLAPAVYAGRVPLIASLKERAPLGGSGRARRVLVVGQLALALILLIGAGLFVGTLTRLRARGTEFAAGSLFMFKLDAPSLGYPAAAAERVMREVYRRVQDIPGVERAAIANIEILNGFGASNPMTIERHGRAVTDREVSRMRVSPGFFATIGARVIDGRDFDERDVRPAGEPARPYRTVIVNEHFARRYFGTESPVGYRVGYGARPDTVTNIEIIGVVREFASRSLRDGVLEQMYLQFWDGASEDGTFYLKLRDRPEGVLAAVRKAVADVDPALPVTVTSIEEHIERSLQTERMLATLSGSFAAIALLLAVVGLYGVLAFVVAQRSQEIGVRMALGATRSAALWLIMRDAAIMVCIGTLIAVVMTPALGRVIDSQLFGVSAFDLRTVALASAVLACVAVGAAFLPAWRAASVSPLEALRLE